MAMLALLELILALIVQILMMKLFGWALLAEAEQAEVDHISSITAMLMLAEAEAEQAAEAEVMFNYMLLIACLLVEQYMLPELLLLEQAEQAEA
jgi:hypothetical protein